MRELSQLKLALFSKSLPPVIVALEYFPRLVPSMDYLQNSWVLY